MPCAPYLRGVDAIYELDGALVAHRPGGENRHGATMPETCHIMTLDKRYDLAFWLQPLDDGPTMTVVWRTARGDCERGLTLEELVAKVHRTFGENPRYRLGAPA